MCVLTAPPPGLRYDPNMISEKDARVMGWSDLSFNLTSAQGHVQKRTARCFSDIHPVLSCPFTQRYPGTDKERSCGCANYVDCQCALMRQTFNVCWMLIKQEKWCWF